MKKSKTTIERMISVDGFAIAEATSTTVKDGATQVTQFVSAKVSRGYSSSSSSSSSCAIATAKGAPDI